MHEHIYDGAPAHHNPGNPQLNTELKKLPPYSPFLNIVEQAISSLKAAIKADISRDTEGNEQQGRSKTTRHSTWPLPDADIDGSTST